MNSGRKSRNVPDLSHRRNTKWEKPKMQKKESGMTSSPTEELISLTRFITLSWRNVEPPIDVIRCAGEEIPEGSF